MTSLLVARVALAVVSLVVSLVMSLLVTTAADGMSTAVTLLDTGTKTRFLNVDKDDPILRTRRDVTLTKRHGSKSSISHGEIDLCLVVCSLAVALTILAGIGS